MKKIVLILIVLSSIFTMTNCEKDEPSKSISIKDLTCNVTSTNVSVHGGHDGTITVNVLTGNGDYIFSLNTTNTNIDGKFTSLSAGTYSLKVTDAENKEFTKDVTITEPSLAPSVETGTAIFVSVTDVTLNGKVNANGYITTSVYFEYGSTTSYGSKINLSNIDGNTLTSVSGKITSGLSSNTTYHYRLVATNSGGTTYGNDLTFSTYIKPTVNSVSTSNIKITSATLNCDVNPQGTLTKIYFEYGTTSSYGNKSIEYNYQEINSNIIINSTIVNLTSNTTYHYRVVAINSGGTIYSNDFMFTTSKEPLVVTGTSSSTDGLTFILNGSINPNDGTVSVWFEYGTSTTYGQIVYLQNTISGSTSTNVNVNVTNLIGGTTYHYRLVCSKDNITYYGNDNVFNTGITIGSEMFGGIVFDVSGIYPNQHGKVVQKTNESDYITWTDANNLNIIRNGATWRLPTWNEMKSVYTNVSNVSSPKITQLSGWYWTSDNSTISIGEKIYFDTNWVNTNTTSAPKTYSKKLRLVTTF